MITKIHFKSKTGTVSTVPAGNPSDNDFVALDLTCSSSLLVLSLYPVMLSLADSALNKNPSAADIAKYTGAILSINDLTPFLWNGNFNIYGSLCTSVTDYTDTTDPLASPRSHNLLVIFDGCYPCSICAELAWLQNLILNCQVWLHGMKDANLYYLSDANSLWLDRYSNKLSNNNPDLCFTRPSSIQMDRSVAFGKAIKLLYQYKQVVAMWNYLVRTKKAHVQIVQAPLDFSGFIIQSKMSLDNCSPLHPIDKKTLTVTVVLQQGQCGEYLSSNNFGIGFYVGMTKLNTYILYGKDSGIHGDQSINNVLLAQVSLLLVSNTILIRAVFLFDLNTKAPTVVSAALKILPVLYMRGHLYDVFDALGLVSLTFQMPETSLSLLQDTEGLLTWVKYRPYATTIELPLQTLVNRWCILVAWSGELSALPQTLYYSTAFGKYPALYSDSGSGSLELLEQETLL